LVWSGSALFPGFGGSAFPPPSCFLLCCASFFPPAPLEPSGHLVTAPFAPSGPRLHFPCLAACRSSFWLSPFSGLFCFPRSLFLTRFRPSSLRLPVLHGLWPVAARSMHLTVSFATRRFPGRLSSLPFPCNNRSLGTGGGHCPFSFSALFPTLSATAASPSSVAGCFPLFFSAVFLCWLGFCSRASSYSSASSLL